MANENKLRAEGEDKKKQSEEAKIREILWNSITDLQSNILSLNSAIVFNDENPRKLAILINSRSRVQQQLLNCIALLGNPKLKLFTDSGRTRDFARLMAKALAEQDEKKSVAAGTKDEPREDNAS